MEFILQSYINNPKKTIGNFDLLMNTQEQKVYINKKNKEVHIVERGTKTLDDIQTDVVVALGDITKSNRFKRSEKNIKDLKEKYKEYDFYGSGHSLGGTILHHYQKKHPTDFQEIYTYSRGSGIRDIFGKPSFNEIDVSRKSDLISVLSENPKRIHLQNYYPQISTNIFGLLSNITRSELKSHSLSGISDEHWKKSTSYGSTVLR